MGWALAGFAIVGAGGVLKLLRRFGAFTLRFWPLWAPWILALLLPFSRPIARIWSDPLGSGIVEFFSRNYDNRGPMPAADKYPADFDLKLWHLLNGEGGFSGGDYFRMRYGQNLDLSAVSRVRKRFPNETLLYALPVQNALGIRFWNQYYGSQSNSNGTQAQARALAPLVERGRQLEPGNALWWLARAQIEWRLGRRDQTLAALERAARSPYYDDKTLEIARRVIAARERYDAPLWASRREMLAGLRGFEAELQINAGSAWSSHGLNLQKRGDVAGALRWSGALAAIGDLMQRDPNAPSTLRVGRSWQKYAWRAGNPAGTRGKLLPNGAQTFAAYAAQNGRPDLASATNSQNARGQAVEKIVGSYARWQYYRDEPWLKAGGLQARMELLEGAAAAAVAMVFYLAVWWMAANIFGWRARGAPSSRAARMGLPTVITLLLATLAGACGWWFLTVQGPTVGPTPMLGQVVGGTLSGFAAVSAPFLLALGCAGWTLWRHRAQFSPSPRVDMELALAPWARLPVALVFAAGRDRQHRGFRGRLGAVDRGHRRQLGQS